VIVCLSVNYVVANRELRNQVVPVAKIYISDGHHGALGREDFGPLTLLKRTLLLAAAAQNIKKIAMALTKPPRPAMA